MTAAEPVRDAVLRVLFDALPTRAAYPTWDRNLLAYDIAGRVTASVLDALTAAGYRLAGPGEVVVRLPEVLARPVYIPEPWLSRSASSSAAAPGGDSRPEPSQSPDRRATATPSPSAG